MFFSVLCVFVHMNVYHNLFSDTQDAKMMNSSITILVLIIINARVLIEF